MGLADLHIHTLYSFDGTCTIKAVLKQAGEMNLNVIAITDHDEIRGSLESMQQAAAYGIGVIPGSEITTAEGHLLALYIKENIPKGLSLEQTLRHVAVQGGVCIAAHPGGMRFNSLQPEAIRAALQKPELARVLLGVEVFNAGLIQLSGNRIGQQLADELPIAQIGSSDAHLLGMVGKGATLFLGTTTQQFRHALEKQLTWPVLGKVDSRFLLVLRWISRYVLRKAGWVSTNAGPQFPLRLSRQV